MRAARGPGFWATELLIDDAKPYDARKARLAALTVRLRDITFFSRKEAMRATIKGTRLHHSAVLVSRVRLHALLNNEHPPTATLLVLIAAPQRDLGVGQRSTSRGTPIARPCQPRKGTAGIAPSPPSDIGEDPSSFLPALAAGPEPWPATLYAFKPSRAFGNRRRRLIVHLRT